MTLNYFLTLGFSKILVTTGHYNGQLNNTEIIDFFSGCSASLPNYPKDLEGTTGQFLDDTAIICGGYPYTNECFSLRKGATSFKSIAQMNEARRFAKSIVTQGRIWVTGGMDGNGNRFSSTEYIPKSSTNEPGLPEPVHHHAIISINDTLSMLIGGWTNSDYYSPETYYFDHQSNTWKNGPKLINGRNSHTAGLIIDHVTHTQHIAVVGGDDGGYYDSVELLLNRETQWKKGFRV